MKRRRRSSTSVRCRPVGLRRGRVLGRRGDRALVYRARGWSVAVLAVLLGLLVAATVVSGLVLAGAATTVVVVLAWLTLALRLTRLEPAGPAGPGGNGPTPPGGAGVREPRRPLPHAPAGAAAMEVPDEDRPWRTAALV